MLYVLAAIGALTVAVLMWKAFGPQPPGSPDSEDGTRPGWPGMPGRGSPKRRQAPIAPDDDPEFLRKLNEQQRKQRDNGDAENK